MSQPLDPFDPANYHEQLCAFLREDLGAGDITTDSLIPATLRAQGRLIAKAPLVLAGAGLFCEVFRLLEPAVEFETRACDGQQVQRGDSVLSLRGSARALLTAERVALNLIQRLSGIATLTHTFVQAVAGTGAKILDTRKTTPGLRAFEKYAVRTGGGTNHRLDLGDAILIKDNHIRLAGGVAMACDVAQIAKAAANSGARQVRWLEVEVTNFAELRTALAHGPDIIMLDNMSPSQVREAVALVRSEDLARRIVVEASGGITLQNVRAYAEAGANWISVGALTHSAPAVDLSFEIEPL